MYALALQLASKYGPSGDDRDFLMRDFGRRISPRSVAVTNLPDGLYRVCLGKDDNFNWCFCDWDHFKLEVFELGMSQLTIPTDDGHIVSVGTRSIRVFPEPTYTGVKVEIDDSARTVLIQMRIGGLSSLNDHRKALWEIVHGYERINRLTKRTTRLVEAAKAGNSGFVSRTTRALLKEVARSGGFLQNKRK